MPEQIVLEWCRDHLRVLSTDGSPRSLQVLAAATLDSHDHVDLSVSSSTAGAAVREWLDGQGVGRGEAMVVLPRDAIVVRRLQIPNAPDDELPELVRFQAATKASTAIDQLVLDYLKVPSDDPSHGLSVVTFTVDRDQMSRLTAVLSAAGLIVQSVTVSPLTVAQLVQNAQNTELGTQHPEMVVYQQAGRIEISVLDRGSLVLSHSIQLSVVDGAVQSKSLNSELARLVVAQTQAAKTGEIKQCYYVSGNPDAGVLEILNKRLDDRVQSVDCAALVSSGDAKQYEPLLGAALKEHGDQLHIDFISPRKKREVPDRRKLYWGVGVALLLLPVTTGYLLFQSKKAALESSIAGLVDREADLDKQLKSGEPRTVAHTRVDTWDSTRTDVIARWTEIQQHLPGTDRIYFTDFRISPQKGETLATFTGTGQAKQRSDVDEMYQKLAENGFRVTPTATRTARRDPDYPIQFDLNVALLREQPSQATDKAIAAN